jgi:hypothetical protein
MKIDSYNLIKSFVLVFLFFLAFQAEGYAQCVSKIELKQVVATENELNEGKVIVGVIASGAYTCALYEVTGSGRVLIAEKRNNGSRNIEFDSLPAKNNLVVSVRFDAEKSIVCKNLQISEISTLKN